MLSVIMLNVVMLSVIYAECHFCCVANQVFYAECHDVKCRLAECLYAESRSAIQR
jgi:hypothetical protein